jgi:hypothetical protein
MRGLIGGVLPTCKIVRSVLRRTAGLRPTCRPGSCQHHQHYTRSLPEWTHL